MAATACASLKKTCSAAPHGSTKFYRDMAAIWCSSNSIQQAALGGIPSKPICGANPAARDQGSQVCGGLERLKACIMLQPLKCLVVSGYSDHWLLMLA